MHLQDMKKSHAKYLFESNRKKKYTDRAVRYILNKYSKKAVMDQPIFPHALRHFLFTWLKKQNIDDALIYPFSGHESRKSLEIYSLNYQLLRLKIVTIILLINFLHKIC